MYHHIRMGLKLWCVLNSAHDLKRSQVKKGCASKIQHVTIFNCHVVFPPVCLLIVCLFVCEQEYAKKYWMANRKNLVEASGDRSRISSIPFFKTALQDIYWYFPMISQIKIA